MKACTGMVVSPDPMVKDVSGTSEKAQSLIEVTASGITSAVSDVPRKAHQPIDCSELGRAMAVRVET